MAPINRLIDTVPFDMHCYRWQVFLEHSISEQKSYMTYFSVEWYNPSHLNNLALPTPSLDWHPSDHISFVDTVHLRKLHTDSPVSVMICANCMVHDIIVSLMILVEDKYQIEGQLCLYISFICSIEENFGNRVSTSINKEQKNK